MYPYAWKGTDCSLWMNMDKMSYDNRHYYYGILLFWSNICIVNDFMVFYSWSQFFCYMHSLLPQWNAHCTRVFFCLCIIRNICARSQAMVLCKVHVGPGSKMSQLHCCELAIFENAADGNTCKVVSHANQEN